jgi:hypothetical protein
MMTRSVTFPGTGDAPAGETTATADSSTKATGTLAAVSRSSLAARMRVSPVHAKRTPRPFRGGAAAIS